MIKLLKGSWENTKCYIINLDEKACEEVYNEYNEGYVNNDFSVTITRRKDTLFWPKSYISYVSFNFISHVSVITNN